MYEGKKKWQKMERITKIFKNQSRRSLYSNCFIVTLSSLLFTETGGGRAGSGEQFVQDDGEEMQSAGLIAKKIK